MVRLSVSSVWLVVLSIVSGAMAQSSSGHEIGSLPTPLSTASSTMASATSSSSIPMPSSSDSAPGGSSSGSNSGNVQSGGLVNYYFVFIALMLAIVGLLGFFVWRRKRRATERLRSSRQDALAQDLTTWDPARSRRRYWQGRPRSAEASREEGLNEHGEAPPPYLPKPADEEAGNGEGGPVIPLQTLSRDEAGLKPPDYEVTHVPVEGDDEGRQLPGASSSNRT